MIEIRDLHASINDAPILKGVNLTVKKGEIHAIMGPNGSGKSTLAKVIVGHPAFSITQGAILFNGEDVSQWTPDERARRGIFLAFQYPVEIPGVNNASFLRLAVNAKRAHHGEDPLDEVAFSAFLQDKAKLVEMDEEFLNRAVNAGFSGGEKKRNEILQMAALDPMLGLLDETDSGLDIDALRIVANGVNRLMTPDKALILVTHYQRLLDYIRPDYVHVLADGRIIKSGRKELALELEDRGYDWLLEKSHEAVA
ncbi:MAG: Fe-S cluster assembly ATPase SufC [Vampirovibrionales bacterium]|nr:Fe-S cluster assembly ATPase SufC [Vampirovibrionales bacterium]